MPIEVRETGRGNTIEIDAANAAQSGKVTVAGSGNHLRIERLHSAGHFHIEISGGARVVIGADCALGNLFIHADRQARLEIGPDSAFNGQTRLMLHETASLRIGRACLFAGEVEVTVSDMHSLIDTRTGERTNPAKDIVIGDRVWIGQRAMILKGAKIGAGAAIGAGSVVTGEIPGNCVAAGVPCRVLHTDRTWRFDLL